MPTFSQTTTPGRTSLLQAVNTMLSVIGEASINTLDGQQINEASTAEATLLEFHRDGQARGWYWNTEKDYPFPADGTGGITVPANLIKWEPNIYQYDGRYQLRGQRVYDRESHTYTITETPILADVVWALAWDECPEVFNRWTLIRSARVFAGRVLGDESVVRLAGLDEVAARAELDRSELAHEKPNSLTGGPGMRPFPTFIPGPGLAGRQWGPYG